MPEIIYKSKDAVVIVKPLGMPSQKDPSGDLDAMTATSELLQKDGRDGGLWLVHRLDRTVGGVMVFAASKDGAARLSREITDGSFKKEYYAVTEGRCSEGEMRDFLFKDSSASKAFVVKGERKGAKLAVLECSVLDVKETEKGTRTLVKINLKTGRFHQIRAQLSSRGTPLVGDGKYGSRDKERRTPALFACALSTPSVAGGRPITACPPTDEYPWCLFDKEKYVLNGI